MLFAPTETPPDLRSGIWKHYKGPLYQVLGYSHNASDSNRVEVLYIGLELDPRKPGPRWSTRKWQDFFATVCTVHHGMNVYSHDHEELVREERTSDERPLCDPLKNWVERFEYKGPYYLAGFERKTPWQEEQL